ncbi:hypothetical protein K2173_009417 [Erythroxylum novogranatense]|uniref:Uncharacterized protein n=1 Tax=Erythroxylum novogranatense TaxID=1862640 RepID=A0AAV8U540_9ROSI|nr:hypothetical protein K2173_009417 [Erythroxylum novogranatense]
MRARLVVFPVRGRNWYFGRSILQSSSIGETTSASSNATPSTVTELWNSFSSSKSNAYNAELVIDFVSNKMNRAWVGLERAPEGTLKNKIHGLGLKLLARVKPSEIFLNSISKEVSCVEITYPSSLNPRLVRRRLRHIAVRGAAIHRKYFYGSVTLLPLTSAFTVLPLPNIPFFWILFRTYSNWRAMKGSEKLLQLVSDCSSTEDPAVANAIGNGKERIKQTNNNSQRVLWVLQPSRELQELLSCGDENDGLSDSDLSNICKKFNLNINDVTKFRHTM